MKFVNSVKAVLFVAKHSNKIAAGIAAICGVTVTASAVAVTKCGQARTAALSSKESAANSASSAKEALNARDVARRARDEAAEAALTAEAEGNIAAAAAAKSIEAAAEAKKSVVEALDAETRADQYAKYTREHRAAAYASLTAVEAAEKRINAILLNLAEELPVRELPPEVEEEVEVVVEAAPAAPAEAAPAEAAPAEAAPAEAAPAEAAPAAPTATRRSGSTVKLGQSGVQPA